MTVDSDGDVGVEPTIAVDAWDVVHITCYDQTNEVVEFAEGE